MTVPFPFKPNWTQSVDETLAYSTRIITSRRGNEQRRAMRVSPRRTIEFLISLNPQRYVAYKTFVERYGRDIVALPDPTRGVALVQPTAGGSATFTVEGSREWLLADAQVCLSINGRAELRTVYSVVDNIVTMTTPVSGAWDIGATIRPALLGKPGDSTKGSLVTDAVNQSKIRFEITPGSEVDLIVPAATSTFNNRELLTVRPNFRETPNITISQPRERVDYGFGVVEDSYPVPFTGRLWQGEFLAKSAVDARALKHIFMRAKGRQGEFYSSTWERDVVLKTAAAQGATTLTIAGMDFAAAFAGSTVHKALTFRTLAPFNIKVSSIATAGGDSVVTLSTPLPAAVDQDVTISWLLVNRFASDEMTLSWRSTEVATISWSGQSLEDL